MKLEKMCFVFFLFFGLLVFGCASSDGPTSSEANSDLADDGGSGGDDGDGGIGGPPSTSNDSSGFKGTWDLNRADIVRGCSTGLDCIPSIDHPDFVAVEAASFMERDDVVYGMVIDGQAYAYPEKILDWHEVVNYKFGSAPITLTYCPLTGSAVAAPPPVDDVTMNQDRQQFGVSGFLYNNNLIVYDRVTRSAWSQMYLRSVNGTLRGELMQTVLLLETTWESWKRMFPASRVVSNDTGFERNYDIFPYGNYKEVEALLFPLTTYDTRLFFKERVHGIITDRFAPSAKTYRFNLFENGARAINDEVDGQPVVVAGMKSAHFYISYSRLASDGTVLTFDVSTDSPNIYPFDLLDNEGTTWNILGQGVSGPRTGQKLEPTDSYNAYWFAWGAFFPGVPIYQ